MSTGLLVEMFQPIFTTAEIEFLWLIIDCILFVLFSDHASTEFDIKDIDLNKHLDAAIRYIMDKLIPLKQVLSISYIKRWAKIIVDQGWDNQFS